MADTCSGSVHKAPQAGGSCPCGAVTRIVCVQPAILTADQVHHLKTWPGWFDDVASRSKEFEVRRDDRGFEPGDWLLLREWDPSDSGVPRVYEPRGYTGRQLIRRIRYVLRGQAAVGVGVQPGFCVLGLARSEVDSRG